ncbi:MAG: 30S ribosomal protein S7 [Oligoflexia bacterium]|nr:30S ribosomal protein S7 [Oligoflexia bacterium]
MSRKHRAETREVLPDSKYQEILVTKFINCLMIQGEKSTAERIFYGALEIVESKTSEDGFKQFKKAINNVRPAIEVKSRRIGGATYQVPVEVRPVRRQSLAIRWIRDCARTRSGKSMLEKLAEEIIDAANNKGGAVKKREDVYKMAEANKAFAHLKW